MTYWKYKEFYLIKNVLDASIYTKLRANYDYFNAYAVQDITQALKHNVFDLVMFKQNEAIAMARVVGDHKITFLIKDIVVKPSYLKQKIGSFLLQIIKQEIAKIAVKNAYICLFASKNSEPFYLKHHFYKRPNLNQGSGMMLDQQDLLKKRSDNENE